VEQKFIQSYVRAKKEVSNNTLSSYAKNLCPEVYYLCIIYLTVPMTPATAERSFSTMRKVKRCSAIAERPR